MRNSQRGASSLIELLAVIGLIGLLLPMLLDILKNANDYLSPIGMKGRAVLAFESADTVMRAIERDLDEAANWEGMFESDGEKLILPARNGNIAYEVDRRTLHRRIIGSEGTIVESRPILKNIEQFTVNVHDGVADISISIANPHPGFPPIVLSTAWKVYANLKPELEPRNPKPETPL
jgi:hypothetical protein